METTQQSSTISPSFFPFITPVESDIQQGNMEVDGSGRLDIKNTGGSSASEGGVGSGSTSETEKGDLEEKTHGDTKNPDTFDPIKESVERAEQERKQDEG